MDIEFSIERRFLFPLSVSNVMLLTQGLGRIRYMPKYWDEEPKDPDVYQERYLKATKMLRISTWESDEENVSAKAIDLAQERMFHLRCWAIATGIENSFTEVNPKTEPHFYKIKLKSKRHDQT